MIQSIQHPIHLSFSKHGSTHIRIIHIIGPIRQISLTVPVCCPHQRLIGLRSIFHPVSRIRFSRFIQVTSVGPCSAIIIKGMCKIQKMSEFMSQYTPKILIRIRTDICTVIYHTCQILIRHFDIRIPGNTRIISHSVPIKIIHYIHIHIFMIIPCIQSHTGCIIITKSTFETMVQNTGRCLSLRSFFCQFKSNIHIGLPHIKIRIIISGIRRYTLKIFIRFP